MLAHNDAGSGLSAPTAGLDAVDILRELSARAPRAPDYGREHNGMVRLTRALATHPRDMLQELAAVASDLCAADTAGVSLLDGDVITWEAVAGAHAAARGRTMPRQDSPCGVCIARDATQLMDLPDRCFPALAHSPRFVETLLVPFRSQGRPVGTVWVVSHSRDKRFDGEDERVMQVLSEYASAAWQLWSATDAAEREKVTRNRFIATLGHELRNPLSVLTSAAGFIRQRLVHTPLPALDVIDRQVRHMTHLVDDLTDIARLQSGKLRLDRAPVDLRTLVREGVEAAQSSLSKGGHVVVVTLDDDPMVLEGDPVRLTQVVVNLVDNAAKYTPRGGTVAVVLTRRAEDAAVIEVRDTGAGIPAESLATIFEPFTQVATGPGGLGLGLAVVRSIVELHGGAVAAASAGPNLGSCFTVTLPIRPAADWPIA